MKFEDIASFEDADMLMIPGGMPGSTNLNEHEGVRQALIAHEFLIMQCTKMQYIEFRILFQVSQGLLEKHKKKICGGGLWLVSGTGKW